MKKKQLENLLKKFSGAPEMVRLGVLDLNKADGKSTPLDVQIQDIIKPNSYVRSKRYNDIALLKLAETITFTKFIRPACLWSKTRINQRSAIATGWGKTEGSILLN